MIATSPTIAQEINARLGPAAVPQDTHDHIPTFWVPKEDSVATFYSLIYRQPVGRHVISICDSVSCWIMGYEQMRKHLHQRLGIGSPPV